MYRQFISAAIVGLFALVWSVSASYDSAPKSPRAITIAEDVDVAASSRHFREALEKQASDIAAIQRILDTDYSAYKKKPDDLAVWVYHASKLYDVNARILVNVMARESGFRPHAVSKAGAVGLMQVKPKAWGVSRKRLLDYRTSTMQGANIIAYYRDSVCSGNIRCALHSYNVGETAYRKGKRSSAYVSHALKGVNKSRA